MRSRSRSIRSGDRAKFEVEHAAVGIVDEDNSELSRRIAGRAPRTPLQAGRADSRRRDRSRHEFRPLRVRSRNPAQIRRRRPGRPAPDRADQRRRDRADAGRHRRQLPPEHHPSGSHELSAAPRRNDDLLRSISSFAPRSTRTTNPSGSCDHGGHQQHHVAGHRSDGVGAAFASASMEPSSICWSCRSDRPKS